MFSISHAKVGAKLAVSSGIGLLLIVGMIIDQQISNAEIATATEVAAREQAILNGILNAELAFSHMQLSASAIDLVGTEKDAEAALAQIQDASQSGTNGLEKPISIVMKPDVLKDIEAYVAIINQQMEAIAKSSRGQSVGLSEVNSAVNDMDQVTQQNAAMVEETTAASSSLANEAANLQCMVAKFKLGSSKEIETPGYNSGVREASAASLPMSSPARNLGRRVASAFGGAGVAVQRENWSEF
ncbi:hypothetical protein [Rhizobium sp. NPDC090279]|uniref:hypothetical protein n=1 Tax=Rhizobium sp. NPDC090279 TaxID=3364499 RepID=UPI00383A835A